MSIEKNYMQIGMIIHILVIMIVNIVNSHNTSGIATFFMCFVYIFERYIKVKV